MDTFQFQRGRAFYSSNSPSVPWTAVFEDEGPAGYFYACDRSQESQEHAILDAMLIYNNATATAAGAEAGAAEAGGQQYLGAVQWSRDGMQCVFYIDGSAQAYIDFATRTSFCRSNFPNFMQQQGESWRKESHAWDDAAVARFESAIYA